MLSATRENAVTLGSTGHSLVPGFSIHSDCKQHCETIHSENHSLYLVRGWQPEDPRGHLHFCFWATLLQRQRHLVRAVALPGPIREEGEMVGEGGGM